MLNLEKWPLISNSNSIDSVMSAVEYFLSSEAYLSSASHSLEQEDLTDELVDNVYEKRQSSLIKINRWEPETLSGVSRRLSLWVLQNYPNRGVQPKDEWDRLILNSYFQLTGLLGLNPVREEY